MGGQHITSTACVSHVEDSAWLGRDTFFLAILTIGQVLGMIGSAVGKTQWRANDFYRPTLASKAGLFEESRLFLRTYADVGDVAITYRALVNQKLPQHSRATRVSIVSNLGRRLTRWNPPAWVLAELCSFAQQESDHPLRLALLLHTARQDRLLYDFVQTVLVPAWRAGTRQIVRSAVQGFLDHALPAHPEISAWSASTREKIAGNVLTVLREGRILKGEASKSLVQPAVPAQVAYHLITLLQAEGIPPAQLPHHPDWQLWLWTPAQAQLAFRAFLEHEQEQRP
jgi:hypothetical protein